MRQAEQQRQQSWRISVHAEFRNFNFRLKATKISPTWKFHRFSIFLKLHNFLLQLRSDSETPPFVTRQRTTLKSRLLAAVHKLRPRRSKNHPVTEVNSPIDRLKHFAYKEPVSKGGSLAVGILAFLFQSIFEDHHRGIIVLSSFLLICFAVLLGKSIPEKSRTVLTLSVVAIVIATAVRSAMTRPGFRSSVYGPARIYGQTHDCLVTPISRFVFGFITGLKRKSNEAHQFVLMMGNSAHANEARDPRLLNRLKPKLLMSVGPTRPFRSYMLAVDPPAARISDGFRSQSKSYLDRSF
ncbi:hypothetical protein AB3S75_032743 [Citrus x aurantiifolia]